ncbi:MAG TPA: leucyl aminopeptidase [Candidatus Sulfopaludibacter sp.]|jgi:leucyl aminopeptidase|nr:leucyl aminopeptidase [Candidatus Sulfopaludibacter sp.]
MQITTEKSPAIQVQTDALIIPVFEDAKETRFGAGDLVESGEVAGKPLELTLLHHVAGVTATRVLLAGAGKKQKFTPADLRKLVAAAVRLLRGKSVKQVAFEPDSDHSGPEFVSAAVEGAILGNFEPDRLKTQDPKKSVDQFTVVGSFDGVVAAAERGRILAEAQNFTRSMVNEPANLLPPSKMAEAARQMADEFGLECEVLEQSQMADLGMGALLGVSQGSAEPPAFIILRYRPGTASSEAHLGLVGKGVTFDTGGISIKPSDGMEKMKYDMAGGAAMIGAMRAIAQLKPSIAVTAFVPCVENMPGSKAQRPGDIVTAMSGKTIEVLNTDAEGRLILADALVYARKQGCTHLVDAATLTGAVVVALGHLNVGLFANDEAMQARVLQASKAEGERMWPMPMDDDYKDYLKSAFADMGNIGGRWAGSITAAMFLKEFAEETPWVHLDIAGTAWMDDAKPFVAKGPTGLPVRTLVRLAMDWNG